MARPWRSQRATGGGWLKAVREALGMTAAELGVRVGVTESAVARLEKSERNDAVRLNSLRRTADALGCDLVYALVPRRPLEDVVADQALRVAAMELAAVEQTMLLEDQALDPVTLPEHVTDYAREIVNQPGLWRSRGAPSR
jgi:predicted DNA-binding mobile mystery protein A